MEKMNLTASQAEILTAAFTGDISADAVLGLNIPQRFAVPFLDALKDARERENTVVILNMAADDESAPISSFLAETQAEKLTAAFKAVAEAANAKECYLIKTADISFELPGARNVVTERSLVLREESALYHMILSGELRSAPLPRDFLSEGLEDKPTVVVDAETLVRAYAAVQPGYEETKLVVVRTPAICTVGEFKTGTPLSTIVSEAGTKAEKSVLLGGLTGTFVANTDLDECKADASALWDFVGVYGAKDCMAHLTEDLASRARKDTCQKCVLCREGTWHFENIFSQVAAGKAKKDDLAMIEDIGSLIHIGSFCSFGQGMANVFVSSVNTNRKELESHFVKKSCPAGVCKAFSKPVIDPAKCTGCTDCLDVCDEDAITGKKKFIHMIDPDMCENCGKCAEVCEEGAIVPQDGTIRVPKKLMRVGSFS